MPSYDFPGFRFQSCCCCCAFLGRFACLALCPVLSTWEGQVLDLVTEGNFHSLLIYWMHGTLALCQRFSTVTNCSLHIFESVNFCILSVLGLGDVLRASGSVCHWCMKHTPLRSSRWLFQYSRLPETQYNSWLPKVLLFIWFPQFFIEKMLRNCSKVTPNTRLEWISDREHKLCSWILRIFSLKFQNNFLRQWAWIYWWSISFL